MSGVTPFLSLLLGAGGGFFPDSFLGAPSFFFFVIVGGVSSSNGRLGGAELGVLVPFSMGVLFRLTCRPDRPRHRSKCCATRVTTKYLGQFGHLTVGNDTFSGAACLKELSGVVGGLDAGVFEVFVCFFFLGFSLSVANGFP